MKSLALAASAFALLGLTLLPPFLHAAGRISDPLLKSAMLLGTALWFASAPWWMRDRSP